MKTVNLCVFLIVILSSGCATIMNDRYVNIVVDTTPSGAQVTLTRAAYVQGIRGQTYTTPAIVKAPRGDGDQMLKIEKPGYNATNILIKQTIDGWIFGNIIFGGFVGLAIDLLSGKGFDFKPNAITLNLEKLPDSVYHIEDQNNLQKVSLTKFTD